MESERGARWRVREEQWREDEYFCGICFIVISACAKKSDIASELYKQNNATN